MYGMILLIIAVISLSGLISYLGDRIGMKVGKKRISLFGLRPKYTSIIITIMTGILIAALTLTIIFVTNNVVRQAVFRIQEVVSRINTLNTQLDDKDQRLTEMQGDIADMNAKLGDLNQQKERLDRELVKNQNELEIARQDIANLSQKRDYLEEMNQELEAKNEELQELNSQLEETNRQLKEENSGLLTENQDLRSENEELQAENNKLSGQNNQLVKQNHTLQVQNQQLTEQSDELRKKIEEQKTQIAGLEKEIRDVTGQFEAARNLTMHYSVGDIVYQRGDIIYTGVVKGGMTGDETVEALTQLLRKADQEVQKKQVKVNEELGTALYLQDDEILAVARAILNARSERVIVRVIASLNVLVGERVMAGLVPIEDFIVFEDGEQLIEKTINASKDTGQLEQELEDLLTEIRVKAVKEGLLEDQQRGVITIDFYRFYQLIKEIQGYQGKIRLKVLAREDIWREDRLSSNLEFKIIPSDEGNAGSAEQASASQGSAAEGNN